jgi:RND family efflux transporter MFP subunit
LDTLKKVSQAIKSEIIALQSWIDYRSQEDLYIFGKATEYQADLETYALTVDSHLSILLSTQESLEDEKETISEAEQSLEEMQRDQPIDLAAAERIVQEKEDALDKLKNPEQYDINDQEIAVKEKELALEKLKAGADDIDIRSKKLLVRQKYEALLAVQEKLAEHNIKAPFDGAVASINISKGDAVTSATVIGTVITEQKIVEVTLNEIDIADVKTGQNATIEFDAVADLTVTGKVIEVDALGAVTQGVVSYKIKIAFDVDDNRIKPGMTASASIIIDSKQDVLLVPLSAVKAAGENSYLEILIDGQSQRRDIVIGSSNDTMIEIIEGIEEGEQVITQTIISSDASQSATASAQNYRNNQTQNANPMQGMMRMMR